MRFNSNIGVVVSQTFMGKISKKSLSEKLEAHPDYPNMLSISDSVEDFGVSCRVYQLQPSSVDFHQLRFYKWQKVTSDLWYRDLKYFLN